MSKQHITAEEKHYIKLNNKLRKEINELTIDRVKLLDKVTLLDAENDSLRKTVKKQSEWIAEISKAVQMTPEDFRKYLNDLSERVSLEQRKQDQIEYIKTIFGKYF
jgi:chromosome segregation ATPase